MKAAAHILKPLKYAKITLINCLMLLQLVQNLPIQISITNVTSFLQGAEQFEIGKIHDLTTPKKTQHSFWKFWRWYGDSYATQSQALTDHRYVVLRGKVEPLDKSRLLHSLDSKTTGVIHRVTTKEVVAVCNGSRFW
jgi:hypothetical protein